MMAPAGAFDRFAFRSEDTGGGGNPSPSDATRPATEFNKDTLPRECVLILAPIGRDAEYARHVLERSGLKAQTCADLAALCGLITEEIGVILIAEEALTSHKGDELVQQLGRQPAWSDIPIIIFTSGGETLDTPTRVMRLFEKSGNVTLLERPVHAVTLISSIQVALRARRRQWEIRDLLEQREQLLNEARTAGEEARSANRMKDQFLATLSHELRTPLNAILGWTQLLSSEDLSPADIRLGIETIDRNARTQAQLIEDLLDVSRIVSGKLRLDLQDTNVADVVHAAVSAVAPAATSRGVRLEYDPGSQHPHISADPARLQQIVWNLLSNAVKFTPKSGTVEIHVSTNDGFVRIAVSDNGIGIDPAFLPYVFDRFRQADGSTTRRQGGLGLGLSIVKQLAELHGGNVEVHSEGMGKGATFTVTLPLSRESSGKVKPPATADSEPKSNEPRVDLSGVSILLVDDEADARVVLERLLLDRNAIVRVAESVTRALDLIDQSVPDIIISDISMPERDGFDLLHEIRTDGHNARQVPVIALTAYARAEDRDKILRAGFSAHVAKPVNAQELVTLVHSQHR